MRPVKALLLAAGLGTRLRPLTDSWPKCLMPIQQRPLLEYWLSMLQSVGIKEILVNLHYLPKKVIRFLEQPQFQSWVQTAHEKELLGTAGTLKKQCDFLSDATILLVHADNWCQCDFHGFLEYHQQKRPEASLMTMMTFRTEAPESCGIVELNQEGIVQKFHEKVENPPSNLANAAVYLLEPEVLTWILKHPSIQDFSTEVLPHFLGKIATWENKDVHRDIGTLAELKNAQNDPVFNLPQTEISDWNDFFQRHPIHQMLEHSTS